MQASIFRARRFWLSSLFVLLCLAFPSTAQEGENLCRTEITQTMSIGETLTGSIISEIPYAFYCFEGERGDTVTVSVAVTDGRLMPLIIITDPVFSQADMANPLGLGEATRAGGTAEATFEIDSSATYLIVVTSSDNSTGAFEITLDAQGRSIFDTTSTETPPDNTDNTDTPDTPDNNDGTTSIDEIVPGETNFCRVEGTEYIEYGASITGELSETVPNIWYCFTGNAGDIVTIETGTASGDIVMLAALAQPFFDLSNNTVYNADQATSRSDSAVVEFSLPEDGDYLIIVQISEGTDGEYYLELSGEAGVVYDCSNEPLALLTSQQWMIAPAEGETPLVTINLACDGQMTVAALGAPEVGFYDIDTAGLVSFVYGNQLFTSSAPTAEGWTITNAAGTAYELIPAPDTACSDELTLSLFNGTWQLGSNDPVLFSFMCNGVVILNYQGQTFAQSYTLVDGELTIDAGQGQVLEFGAIAIADNAMTVTFDGDEVSLANILAN